MTDHVTDTRRRWARATIAGLAGLGVAVTAGCGSHASLPGGHVVTVPSVSIPSVPRLSGIDLSKDDAASARHAVCTATDVWLSANEQTRKLIRPTVDKVLAHYRASPDSSTSALARAGQALVNTDSTSEQAKRSTWKRLCG